MRTIVVASQKGGAGKTSLLRNVAVVAAGARKNVVMLDADPQGSLTTWYNGRGQEVPGRVRLDGQPIPALLDGLRGAWAGGLNRAGSGREEQEGELMTRQAAAGLSGFIQRPGEARAAVGEQRGLLSIATAAPTAPVQSVTPPAPAAPSPSLPAVTKGQ